MATALQLVNRALLKLGEPVLTALTGTGAMVTRVAALFPSVLRAFMVEDDWYWARKRAVLAEDEDNEDVSLFDHAYDLPADCLYPRYLYATNGVQPTYHIEGLKLYSDAEPDDDSPVLVYTGDPLDELTLVAGNLIPAWWEDAFAAVLAAELAFPTSRDAELSQRLRGEALFLTVARAKQLNAMAEPGYGDAEEDWGGSTVDTGRRHPKRT